MPELLDLLPHLQAGLNVTAALLMILAFRAIRQGDPQRHQRWMIAALIVSTLFFISYLYYHSQVGNVKFAGEGAIRPLYFSLLTAHIVAAAMIIPLIFFTLIRALGGRREAHRRIARWTLPVWLFVSISGVVVYWMAFHLYPSGG